MHVLDNVCYQSLITRHAQLAESFDQARRFIHEISVIGGILEPTPRGYESLARLVKDGQTVNLALEAPYQLQPGWTVVFASPMLQMVYQGAALRRDSALAADETIVELGKEHIPEMIELTSLTRPGPFSKRTHELGTYLGIFQNEKLIAMAGERLKVPGYTEVSAVCTRPEQTGKGYARRLMTTLMEKICDRGETPFLHVREANTRAIGLYERIGFVKRVVLQLAVLRRER